MLRAALFTFDFWTFIRFIELLPVVMFPISSMFEKLRIWSNLELDFCIYWTIRGLLWSFIVAFAAPLDWYFSAWSSALLWMFMRLIVCPFYAALSFGDFLLTSSYRVGFICLPTPTTQPISSTYFPSLTLKLAWFVTRRGLYCDSSCSSFCCILSRLAVSYEKSFRSSMHVIVPVGNCVLSNALPNYAAAAAEYIPFCACVRLWFRSS